VEIHGKDVFLFSRREGQDSNTSDRFLRVKSDKGALCLRAKSDREAEEWAEVIRQTIEKTTTDTIANDSDYIVSLDYMMADEQEDVFIADSRAIHEANNFGGMLKNRYLRGEFQKFLERNFTDEAFKFWQYAEDYRRGHPMSTNRFEFEGNTTPTTGEKGQALYVKHWASKIHSAFTKDQAPHQISDCSSEDRTKIEAGLSNTIPSPLLFAQVQTATFRSLKFKWYPEFVQSINYQRYLKASTIAARAIDRDSLLRGFINPTGSFRSAYSIETGENSSSHPTMQQSGTMLGKIFNGVFRKQPETFEPKNSSDKNEHLNSPKYGNIDTPWRLGNRQPVDTPASSKCHRTAFDSWIPEQWWSQIDVDEWNDVNSNAKDDASLQMMMPSWLPNHMVSLNSLYTQSYILNIYTCLNS